jgi:hypothetical protein
MTNVLIAAHALIPALLARSAKNNQKNKEGVDGSQRLFCYSVVYSAEESRVFSRAQAKAVRLRATLYLRNYRQGPSDVAEMGRQTKHAKAS